ncbi:MAG: sugar ABC transporter substrate-binding protein [Candidatus Promineifilaceae bacterium]
MNRFFALLFILSIILIGCTANDSDEDLSGQLLLWHSWGFKDRQTLNRITDQFHEIYPDVEIITVAIPAEDLQERYRETAALGLGPDVVIGSDRWIPNYIEENLLQEIPPHMFELVNFSPNSLDTARSADGILYGIPLAQNATVLYYNKSTIQFSAPPETFEEWVNFTNGGEVTALNVDFEDAYWGISPFGNGLFDPEGQIRDESDGLLGWLRWLKEAQSHPNIILSRDTELLQDLFIDGTAHYYVGWSDELPDLLASMGQSRVGVAPLPHVTGSELTPVPLLRTEVILFNESSSNRQTKLAYAFTNFLTNTTQSAILMRETQRVPANRLLQISSEVDELQFMMAEQIAFAEPPPVDLALPVLAKAGAEAYNNVLTGIQQPEGAVALFWLRLETEATR